MLARTFSKRFRCRPLLLLGTVGLSVLAILALLAPWLYPGDPLDMAGRPRLWPGEDPEFPLGTDSLGRDITAGLLYGARISLLVGFNAMLAGVFVGVAIGATAGFFGRTVDSVLMGVTEVFLTIPSFMLVIVLLLILEPSVASVGCSIAAVSWPGLARVARAEVLALREREFVEACRASGMTDFRIVATQILPNCAPTIFVSASAVMASAIMMEASVSFLGLGDPNVVSWGSMISAGRPLLRTAWYVCALPGFAIIATVLLVSMLAQDFGDALDPVQRQ